MKKSMVQLAVASCLALAAGAALACEGGPCPTVQSHFKELDTNKDGVVTKAEFDAGHAKHFKAMDANHDGKVTVEEMEAAHDQHHGMSDKPHGMNQAQHTGTFKEIFDQADTDHDGALSKAEAQKMPMILERFDEFDANKDGKVTYDEIRDAMKIMHHQPSATAPAAK
jgi:Ca2+-binding EF-hand superfamily protein